MSLHVDNHHGSPHDGSPGDRPVIAIVAVAIVLVATCAAIFYMGNTYRVKPTYLIRQPLSTPF